MLINNIKRFLKREILFCDIHPICYELSTKKEIHKRNKENQRSQVSFAKEKQTNPLGHSLYQVKSKLIKTGKDIDPVLQENKALNIRLASEKINKIVIHPGEIFSFWALVGKISKKNGYKEGRVIVGDQIEAGMGGGLCNLANTIHRLVLHSPLKVIELHTHSDALAPDEGEHIPFATGTSIVYNYMDYRFINPTHQSMQLLLWCDETYLHGELRSEKEIDYTYHLIEKDHHFAKEGEKYYRNSQIYREIRDAKTKELIDCEFLLDNHSEVMYDYTEIPKELIRNGG